MGVRALTVAVVGATGAAGRAVLQALEESELDVGELRLLCTEHGAGAELDFRGELHRAEAVGTASFRGCDLAVLAAGAAAARTWVPPAREGGCAVVDLSPAFRADAAVQLVVPELAPAGPHGWGPGALAAVPGAGAAQLALVLAPLHAAAGVERVVVASYEAVSGAGQRGIEELEREIRAMLAFQDPPPATALPHRVAFNVVPQAGPFGADGASEAERALGADLARVLAAPAPRVSATAVRVPVFYGLCQAVNVRTARPLGAAAARALLSGAPGVKVVDAPAQGVYPMPMLAVNDEAVLAGRIRDDGTEPNALSLFLAGEPLRRAAASAVALARRLAEAPPPR